MKVRIVSNRDIHELLTYPACIEVVRAAMMEVSRRNVHMPLRHGMPLPNGNGRLPRYPYIIPSHLARERSSLKPL